MKSHSIVLGLSVIVATLPALTVPSAAAAEIKKPRADQPCYVHLFDGDNFKDENDIISGPGRWGNLRNLPGASKTIWGDEADSLKVGPAATLKVWDDTDFKGKTNTFGPGTEKADLDEEPESMEITCKP